MPKSTGGNAIGSPTFSDSSTRKTSGSRTRKPTITRTASVVRACPLMRRRHQPSSRPEGRRPEVEGPIFNNQPQVAEKRSLRCASLRSASVGTTGKASTPGAVDAVPFLGEGRAVLLELVPVGGRQELHLLERHGVGAARRRHVLARRMEQQRLGQC